MNIVNCGRGVHQREVDGLEKLRALPDNWLAFSNLDLAIPGKGLREIDLIMILDDRVLLIDLKDWKGPICSRDASWFNGNKDCGRSPVQKLGEHTRSVSTLLKAFLAEQSRREGVGTKLPYPLVDAAVVLTRTVDRTGIAAAESARVFGIDQFMKMLRNPKERDAQLGSVSVRGEDYTKPEWIKRFRRFFNASNENFRAASRSYGSFRANGDSPTFAHPGELFYEFDVAEVGVPNSSGFLRRWDFSKAEPRFQTEEGRALIAGREKEVIAWLDDRSAKCGQAILKQRSEDQERGTQYWEVYERRRHMRRLSDFCGTELSRLTAQERLELTRQVLAAAKTMHDLEAAHLDIGPHSIWLEMPTTAKFSHLMAASYPQVKTLGQTRYQFLSSGSSPEEILGVPVIALRKDIYSLACAAHMLLFGSAPEGEPAEWNPAVDADGNHSHLHPWFSRSLDLDATERFAHAAEMLEAFNAALASLPDRQSTVEGLEHFRQFKSQLQLARSFPVDEMLAEDDRVDIWRSNVDGHSVVVKLWKASGIGDLAAEASRILSFLQQAKELVEAPIPGTARLSGAYWTGDAIALVQEFVPAPSLAAVMASGGLDGGAPSAVAFAQALTDVVERMHGRLVAHGDLKPENIHLCQDEVEGAITWRPILIDLLDFSPATDGDRANTHYSPPFGGRFERDRFAVTKLVEELFPNGSLLHSQQASLASAIDRCREGPPANGSLSPLADALATLLTPPVPNDGGLSITIGLPDAVPGILLADEGQYWVSRFSRQLVIRGANEQLEVRLDERDVPKHAKRSAVSQGQIARAKRHERVSFSGQIRVAGDTLHLGEIVQVLDHPEVRAALTGPPVESDAGDGESGPVHSHERAKDELAEEAQPEKSSPTGMEIRRLWRRLVERESELISEAFAVGESSYRREAGRHVVPIQMTVGEFGFDRNDTVVVERVESSRVIRIGVLDISSSSDVFIAIESRLDAARGPLVADGSTLRFQSRYENTSRERRSDATIRLVGGGAALPALIDYFDPTQTKSPSFSPHVVDEELVKAHYGLNDTQASAFARLATCRPLGLLQGPPGTGKTKFIGALVHYALTHGLARNVLLASQSHEAVNTAAEAVLRLLGNQRDSVSLIRVGHEGVVSEPLRPFHAAKAEVAYKDRFAATFRERMRIAAKAIGLDSTLADSVLWFEDSVMPVIIRLQELAGESQAIGPRADSLLETIEQLMSSREAAIPLLGVEIEDLEGVTLAALLGAAGRRQAAKVDKLRHVVQLGRDIVGSVSTWQRSFETFLAGTRQVVAGTCVGLGRTALGLTKTTFDLVIVDEAARCTASELAVPIQAGKWVVLVGDHAQLEPSHLPEVVKSLADELGMSRDEIMRSDFERAFLSPYGKQASARLDTQYRMLPPIGRVVSAGFYSKALKHGRRLSVVADDVWPQSLGAPLLWLETDSSGAKAFQREDESRRGSLINPIEADAIVSLLRQWAMHEKFLAWLKSREPGDQAIGIICAYSGQRDLVRKRLNSANLPDELRRSLKVDTIDSYQGKENRIVIVSLVRNNAEQRLSDGRPGIRPGFLGRKNRLNVAVSRGMDRLVIVGAKDRWPDGGRMDALIEAFDVEQTNGSARVVAVSEITEQGRHIRSKRPAKSRAAAGDQT